MVKFGNRGSSNRPPLHPAQSLSAPPDQAPDREECVGFAGNKFSHAQTRPDSSNSSFKCISLETLVHIARSAYTVGS